MEKTSTSINLTDLFSYFFNNKILIIFVALFSVIAGYIYTEFFFKTSSKISYINYKDSSLFNEDYRNRKPFPIFALPHYLDQNQGILTRDSETKKQYNRLKKVYSEVEEDVPVLFSKMLKAHDAIRKQLGKKVNYAFTPFSHEGVEKVINKMYIEENLDLSHLEVQNIVKEVDSYDNISKEYGISKDQVYLIKSHFRR